MWSMWHLLFECVFVKKIWELVENMQDCKIAYEDIGGFENNQLANYVSNISAFVTYKDWLLHSLRSEKRKNKISRLYFEYHLNPRLEIYEKAGLTY